VAGGALAATRRRAAATVAVGAMLARLLALILAARSDTLEAMVGLGLVTVGVAKVWSVGAACIVAGTVIFLYALLGRRLRRWAFSPS